MLPRVNVFQRVVRVSLLAGNSGGLVPGRGELSDEGVPRRIPASSNLWIEKPLPHSNSGSFSNSRKAHTRTERRFCP